MVKVPKILTLRISRFNSEGKKLDKRVRLPMDDFDLGQYVSNLDAAIKTKRDEALYELNATSNHEGNYSRSGHYTSYVKGTPGADGNAYVFCLTVLIKFLKMIQR